jgi:predicted PurR-regulated permease PerM
MNTRITPARIYAAVIVVASAWVVHGFVPSVLVAIVVAIASWSLYARFAASLPAPMRGAASAAIFTVMLTVFVLAPMMFAGWALLSEAQAVVRELMLADRQGIAVPAWLAGVPLVGPWAADRWQSDLAHPGALAVWAQRADPKAFVAWAQSLGQFAGRHALIVVFSLLLLFFLYCNGDQLVRDFRQMLRHSVGERAERYVDVVTHAVRASVNGMLIVALFDGVVTGASFALAGAPRPASWGAIIGALAAIPFLGYAAVGALALHLALQGQASLGLFCLALGSFVLLCGDKVVRPAVASEGLHLPFVWVLMGCIGGFEVLGLVGLAIGPVVLALARELWEQRVRSVSRIADHPRGASIHPLPTSSCQPSIPSPTTVASS